MSKAPRVFGKERPSLIRAGMVAWGGSQRRHRANHERRAPVISCHDGRGGRVYGLRLTPFSSRQRSKVWARPPSKDRQSRQTLERVWDEVDRVVFDG